MSVISPRRLMVPLLALAIASPAVAPAREQASPVHKPEAAVAALLDAGLNDSFERYLAALHPDARENETQREHRRKFDWARFRQQASWYVRDRVPASFVVVRRQQESPHAIKLFLRDLHNQRRMPVPVHLRRHGNRWYIKTHSL